MSLWCVIVSPEVVEAAVLQWSEGWTAGTSRHGRRGRNVVHGQRARNIVRNGRETTYTKPHLATPPRRPYQAICQLHLHVLCVHAHRVRHGNCPRPRSGHGPVSAVAGHSARQYAIHSVGV